MKQVDSLWACIIDSGMNIENELELRVIINSNYIIMNIQSTMKWKDSERIITSKYCAKIIFSENNFNCLNVIISHGNSIFDTLINLLNLPIKQQFAPNTAPRNTEIHGNDGNDIFLFTYWFKYWLPSIPHFDCCEYELFAS